MGWPGQGRGRHPYHRRQVEKCTNAKGRSYRLIGRGVGLSKNTVADIVKRGRINAVHTNAPIG